MRREQLFFDPIDLPDGRTLRSFRDADEFIQSLPSATQDRPEWRTATESLLLVVECNGDPMFARIGIMRALNAKGMVYFGTSEEGAIALPLADMYHVIDVSSSGKGRMRLLGALPGQSWLPPTALS